jgi:hypothetical protein
VAGYRVGTRGVCSSTAASPATGQRAYSGTLWRERGLHRAASGRAERGEKPTRELWACGPPFPSRGEVWRECETGRGEGAQIIVCLKVRNIYKMLVLFK